MKLIAIAGPTGIGKTDLAMKFTDKVSLISCDSVMIYNELNIGSNKEHVNKHVLMNIRNIKEKYDVNLFVNDFIEVIELDKNYMLVGGCGLYMDRAIESYNVLRECYQKIMKKKEFIEWNLPENKIIHALCFSNSNIPQKLTRNNKEETKCNAFQDFKNTIDHQKEVITQKIFVKIIKYIKKHTNTQGYEYTRIDKCDSFYLTCKRENLYRKIDERCEIMILNGFFDELIELEKLGLTTDSVIGRSIGYRDGLQFFKQICDDMCTNYKNFLTFLESFKKRSRNYARKQETWYKSKNYIFINKDEFDAYKIILMMYENKIDECGDIIKNTHQQSIITNKDARKELKTYVSENKHFDCEKMKHIIEHIKNKR